MSDLRSQGRKKSLFPAQTSVLSSDTFDFVRGATNFKINFSDLLLALGATGTIEQDGAVTGTPVLDVVATVNKIRNLEDGSGVKASVSPENGITLDHNFGLDTVGAALSDDFTLPQPKFRSITAGPGITVAGAGNQIQISTSAVAASTKTVVVSQLSDFPTPVVGVITLLDDTEYLLINDVNISGNRFVLGDKTSVRGTDSVQITLTYTGTGVLFTSATGFNRITLLTIDATTGTLFDVTISDTNIFRMTDCTYNVDIFGTFNGLVSPFGSIARFTNVSGVMSSNGLLFTGNWRAFIFDTSSSTITSAGTFLDLGTATFDAFYAKTVLVSLASGSFFAKGLASSGNINVGGIGSILDNRFSGLGVPLSGITVNDALWEFAGNDDIANTRPDGLLSMQSNATNTVIVTAGVAVLVAGTWIVETASQFTGTTSGRLTYNGGKDAKLPITASVTLSPVSGGTIDMGVQIALNGVLIPNSLRVAAASSSGKSSITAVWQLNLSTNDFVEIFASNEDSTVDLLVSSAVLRIN